ncbi:MAG: aldehyde dehydrogenase family protein [Planctomycetes bacterium]|nr:aldehyde dehydrogenase family protein [Planctomycetota bacterium]
MSAGHVSAGHAICGHWIGGAWRASTGDIDFTTRHAARRWPRGNAQDALVALDSAASALAKWTASARRERIAALRRLLGALESDGTLVESFRAAFACDDDEARSWCERELFAARQALEIVADDVAERRELVVCGAHWSDGVGRLLARVIGALASGATLAVASDGLFPDGAAALARAAQASELPPGVMNILFDDGRAVLDAWLGDPRVDRARLAGTETRLAALARAARPGLVLALKPAVSTSLALPDACDPREAAAAAVETSFSRSGTLSGQLPGRHGRVLCPKRHFSRFCEELLAALDRHPDVARPLPLFEPDALESLEEAWFLGLDEGATPLAGGPPWFVPQEGDRGGGPGGDRRSGRRALGVRPVVFTHVDPKSRSGRFRRAVPVLWLMRVPDARAGEELARRLDA